MAKNIEVSDEVFKALQELAEPFVDAPCDVIAKLIGGTINSKNVGDLHPSRVIDNKELLELLKSSSISHKELMAICSDMAVSEMQKSISRIMAASDPNRFTLGTGIPSPHGRAKKGTVTPQSTYEDFLLEALCFELGWSATKADATVATIDRMKRLGILKEIDFERVSTGETRAVNGIAWARQHLKVKGLIRDDSPRGVWELTEEGRQAAEEMPTSKHKGKITSFI